MQQLLRITSTPAKIAIESSPARLQIHTPRPQVFIERVRKGLRINTEPVQIQISSQAMRQSILTLKSPIQLMDEYAEQGLEAAKQATINFVERGNQMADIAHGVTIAQIFKSTFIPNIETGLSFIPEHRPVISFTKSHVNIEYEPDELHIEWDIQGPQIDYIPYSVSTTMISRPSVEIEYLGGPNYFPDSPHLLEEQRKAFISNSK